MALPGSGQTIAPTTAPVEFRNTLADAWPATDALGRRTPAPETLRPPRPGRFVAIFYFLWHDAAPNRGPFDISKILAQDPLAMATVTSPPWGPLGATHYWGEPLFGYYRADDPWVIRKHAQMLCDAGVDLIVLDNSNNLTYRHSCRALLEVYRQMRAEGNRTPQIAFLTPFGDPASTVRRLVDDLYSRHDYDDLWFRWEGKPLILANPAHVHPEDLGLLTFRRPQPDYFNGATEPNMWSWLEVFPQHVFLNARGEKEQMSVGVAQNAVDGRLGSMSEPGALGRSYHNGHAATQPSDEPLGLNVAEQWERAISEDPQIVFVTGWNEWIAGRFAAFNGIRKPPMFVDEFDREHSRDIEPMKGGHGDDYYYQLVFFVRRFKGTRPAPPASAPKTIIPGADPNQWDDVAPAYRDDLGDTVHRDHPGVGDAGLYRDDSGRNDFDVMKVARDADYLYFSARAREPLTEPAGGNWMILLLDVDRDHSTGWEGYDFLVNRARPEAGACTVERNVGGARKWELAGQARLVRRGNQLEIAVPRKLLGLPAEKGPLNFEFKWADNVPTSGDITDFITRGDVASNGRFNYIYRERANEAK